MVPKNTTAVLAEESVPPDLRHITASFEHVPGAILEMDGMPRQHQVTGRHELKSATGC